MIYLFAFLAVVLRLLPHAPNFAPMGALALWAGISGDKCKIWLPLGAVFATDLFLGAYPGLIWVYASYALIFLTGYLSRPTSGLSRHLGLPFTGASLFYLVSNFGVWATGSIYPANLTGLVQCYAAAIPFFRNTLTSDLLYFNVFILLARAPSLWKSIKLVQKLS